MTSSHVTELIHEVLGDLDRTLQSIETANQEIETLHNKYEHAIKYDTRFYYSDGFWDGFMYGAVLMSSIMSGLIYFLR